MSITSVGAAAKTCTKCGEVKSLDEFHAARTGRYGRRAACKTCVNAGGAVWYAANSEKIKANKAIQHAANPEKARARVAAWRAEDPERDKASQRRSRLKLKYDITPEEYDEMLAAQGGCAICGTNNPGSKGAFEVDHDHACCSGTKTCGNCIRGLLCSECNIGIGKLGDTVEGVMRALIYLLRTEPSI